MLANPSSKSPLRGFIHRLVVEQLIAEDAAIVAVQQATLSKISLVKYLLTHKIIAVFGFA